MKKIGNWLINSFVSGLFTLVPLFVTFAALRWVLGILYKVWNSFLGGVPIPGIESRNLRAVLVFLALVASITLLGALSRIIFVKEIILFFDRLLEKVPIVKIVYSGTKQVLSAIFSGENRKFHRAVLVEYPRRGAKSIGFITSRDPMGDGKKIGVFIPTSPNPTSGFFVMVDRDDVEFIESDLSEVFRILVSGGIGASRLKIEGDDGESF